jgi:hypothetical protein
MSKQQENALKAQPEFGSKKLLEKLESLGDALIESLTNSPSKKGNLEIGTHNFVTEDRKQPTSSLTVTIYTAAIDEFNKSAAAFIEHLPLLVRVRNAYENALTASAELRTILDADDEKVKTLMSQLSQLEQGVKNGVKPPPDKNNSKPAKVETIGRSQESINRASQFL